MPSASKHINEIVSGLSELWVESFGDPSIKIAILDGPVDDTHPSLTSADLIKKDIYHKGGSNITKTAVGHGTHVASIIFGQHDSAIKGIAPNCTGLILPVFQDDATGNVKPCSQIDLARAISQAIDAGANVINISGGELSPSGEAEVMLSNAIERCKENNVLLVAAAGNNGCACIHIPGANPHVLAVGAIDQNGMPLEFSNWGDQYSNQGILAPGENIAGAVPSGKVELRTGTSYATPIVSGVAALLMSIQKMNGLVPNGNEIRSILLESATGCDELKNINCQRLLKGIINLKNAVSIIQPKNGTLMSKDHQMQSNIEPSSNLKTEEFIENEQLDEPNLVMSHQEMDIDSSEKQIARTIKEEEVIPSDCGCGGGEKCSCGSKPAQQTVQIVFALGSLGYDFGSDAARNSLAQHMGDNNPENPAQLVAHLEKNPWEASSITWTLKLDSTPIYAIRPSGAFAAQGYAVLRNFMRDQIEEGAERISVPGYVAGQTRLTSGQVLPVIIPKLRCMYNWNTQALLESVLGKSPAANAKKEEKEAFNEQKQAITNFLERVYHELRNLGTSPQERAINYAATNALNTAQVFAEALNDKMQLDTIEVERSAICRMGSDCWDVILTFFDPEKQLTRARKCYRFTIDVSYACPVMMGSIRSWHKR